LSFNLTDLISDNNPDLPESGFLKSHPLNPVVMDIEADGARRAAPGASTSVPPGRSSLCFALCVFFFSLKKNLKRELQELLAA